MPMKENTMPTTYKHFRIRSEGNEKMPLTFARTYLIIFTAVLQTLTLE